MALTDTRIRALKPREKRYLVTDERGLALEVYPSGGMCWRFRYRLNGKLEKVVLGKYPDMTLLMARDKRDELGRLVAGGQSPARQKQLGKQAQADAVTVADFAERFFRDIQAKARRDNTIPRRYLDKDVLPFIGSKRVRDLTPEDMRGIIWRKKDHGFDAAAGQVRGLLKRMLDYAVTCGLLPANPVMALPMRHVFRAKARERTLAPAEVRVFLHAVNQSNIRRQFRLALNLILLTMVRKSELLLARWRDVDLDAGEWSIPAESSKTGKPHVVYLSRQAVDLFRELKVLSCGSELVLPGRGSLTKPFAHNAINTALKVALKGEDVPAFTIHDLRRTASTLLHEAGFATDVVEKALNHTIGGVRGVYNRAEYADQRRQMLQWWADFVDSQIQEGKGKVIIGPFGKAYQAA